MSNRIFYSVIGTAAIVSGALFYLFFRDNSYFTVLMNGIMPLERIRILFADISFDFIQFYLPDLLWAFSFGCGLLVIFDPNIKGCIVCALTSALYGAGWELMQYFDVISGTGDMCDVIMYLAAGIILIFICLKRSRKNEENQ